ncbi:MAG: aspartate dehydrogenase domain-containing protein [Candidatus Bathyarchaeia archaeon]|jgi:aspartate dehydrogenase
MVKKVGLIGCGAIGTVLAEAFERKILACDELLVFDIDAAQAEKLKGKLKFPVKIAANVDEILAAEPKVIVEAAGQSAVHQYYDKLVASKAEIIFMSTGALLDHPADNPHVHFPAGAIGGLDAIAAAANAGIEEITLATRKNPKALGKQIEAETVTFEGDAEEAARQFPREMNVAATLALTVKPTKVHVKVIADPKVTRNTHQIHIKWRYGEMNLQFANDPHPDNPHTSALAAWAAIRLLQTLLQ